MGEADVWAEYRRLGYDRGWVFGMTPLSWMYTAKAIVVGLNPGGKDGEHDAEEGHWEHPLGSAYHYGQWCDTNPDYRYPIQVQVQRLYELLGYKIEDVFAAQFIPFRSRALATLPHHEQALSFSKNKLWKWVCDRTPAHLFICMGGFTAWHIADLLKAQRKWSQCCGWGKIRIHRYVSPDGKVVVAWPHPSTYKILSMQDPAKLARARLVMTEACSLAEAATVESC